MIAPLKLLQALPATLKIAWLLLWTGLLALVAGFFMHVPWQSYSGLGCLIAGFVMAILDMRYRKKNRGDAAGFYLGATLSPVIAVIVLAFVALLFALVIAIQSMMHGFSVSNAMRVLHFMGVMFAFLIVTGIHRLALRSRPDANSSGGHPQPP